MKRKLKYSLLIVTLISIFVLISCGGDDSTKKTTTENQAKWGTAEWGTSTWNP